MKSISTESNVEVMPGGGGSLTRLAWPQLSQKKVIHPIPDKRQWGEKEKNKIRPWLIKGSRNLITINVVLYTQRIAQTSNDLYIPGQELTGEQIHSLMLTLQ